MQTSNDCVPEGGQKSFSTLQDRKNWGQGVSDFRFTVVLTLGLVIFA
jgi:hypothetical protein